jgi:hypothetical protein
MYLEQRECTRKVRTGKIDRMHIGEQRKRIDSNAKFFGSFICSSFGALQSCALNESGCCNEETISGPLSMTIWR